MFDRRYGGVDALVARVVSAMALYGAATEHPEIDPDDYVTPAAAAASSRDPDRLPDEITAAFLAVPFDGFYATTRSSPSRPVPSQLPTMSGASASTRRCSWCKEPPTPPSCRSARATSSTGCATSVRSPATSKSPAQGTTTSSTRSLTQVQGWFADRLANRPATTSCAPRPGVPTVVPGVGSVPEGNAGTAELDVPLSLSAASDDTVTVQWRTIEPDLPLPQAESGTDYTAGSGTVTFAPGQTQAHVRIAVRGDTEHGVRRAHRRVLRQPDPRAHGRLLGTGLRIARRRRLIPLGRPGAGDRAVREVSSA